LSDDGTIRSWRQQQHHHQACDSLPLFSPDFEAKLPRAVQSLHSAVAQADAIMIASPEYGQG
jgi:NAD(P)H-dependent FMN reductase